jgi:hypothetical protein
MKTLLLNSSLKLKKVLFKTNYFELRKGQISKTNMHKSPNAPYLYELIIEKFLDVIVFLIAKNRCCDDRSTSV